eukprot:TRINITY_DN29701_c0_g1_i1.p1 TRINITY_DN29701_c0_g1~~TRINITY_DN29701_c0_g1_i1.p1  ORF type:complete len:555 (-),score=79.91 TRINITY_DN29701_c0_g1_i1:31-1695(-)
MGGPAQRPNILFVFGEDWGRFASAYGRHGDRCRLNTLLSTPNFDRLASEGVLFLNARAPAPGCNPCRSSVMSGRYFWQTGLGAIEQGTVWDENLQTFPLELERSGYFLGYTYEGDFGKTNARLGGQRTAFNSAGRNFGDFSRWVTRTAKELPGGVEEAKATLLEEVRGNFRSFLQAHKKSLSSGNDQTPFCYCWGPTTTHRGDGWEPGSGKALWGIDPEHLQGIMPDFLPDVHAVRQDLSDYLGECCAMDAGLGVLLEELTLRGDLDNTLIVVSGDHGPPGFPRAKATCYDLGTQVALAVRWPRCIPAGRVVHDFVNTMDLAPTLCEAGGLKVPPEMCARSLMPILLSRSEGQVEADRDFVVSGLERHVSISRDGFLPYPQRSIRTSNFLYIINFEPDRWPMGDPHGLDDLTIKVGNKFDRLSRDTMLVFSDFDGSPTKAWLLEHRGDRNATPFFLLAFGKRPSQELYDLSCDPHCMRNVANERNYSASLQQLDERLKGVLSSQGDPRLLERPCRFELPPYAAIIEKYTSEKGKAFLEELRLSRSEWQSQRARL